MANPSLVVRVAANLAELKANLAEGRNQIEVTGQAMQRMAASLSGEKLIADAHKIVGAVDQIGGAAKLTEQEKARLNGTLDRAIEKYRLLGKDAPEAMLKLHTETKPVVGGIEGILGKLGPLASAIGIGFSVGAVVSFGKELLADADALVKLADKTGLSIEATQRLKYAAEQSGNTFEQVTGAITAMQNRLAEGDKSAVGALRALGLSLEQLRAMTPDQQFTAIAREVAKIEDPMTRTKVAMDLFGKAGAEILPTLIADITELGNQAPVMSEKAVKAFDTIGDAISRAWGGAKTLIGESIGTAIDGYSRLGQAATALVTGDFGKVPTILADIERELPKLPPPVNLLKQSADGLNLSWAEMDRISKELTKDTEAQIAASEKQKQFQDALFGRDLIARANQYIEALDGVGNITKLTEDKKKELKRAVDAALAAYAALGETAPAVMQEISAATTPLLESTSRLATNFVPLKAAIEDSSEAIREATTAFEVYDSGLVFTTEVIADVSNELDKLEQKAEEVTAAVQTLSGLKSVVQFDNPYALSPNATPQQMEARAKELGGVIHYDDFGNPYVHVPGANRPGYASRNLVPRDPYGLGNLLKKDFPTDLFRAAGGPVDSGRAYVVGERGPELFVPQRSGTIVPNGGAAITIAPVIHVGAAVATKQELARYVCDAIIDLLKSQGHLMPARV